MPEALEKTKQALVQLHGRVNANTTPQQRRWALIAIAGLIVATLSMSWLSSRADWRLLDSNLDPKDAQLAAVELAAAKIPYQLDADGTSLRVPAQQVDKARLSLAAKGLPHSGRMGFELFDKPNWIGSEFDEKVNYERALEGELEHTIGTMGAVESARVHLVLPHDALFENAQRSAKASVILNLNRRGLSDVESDSIRTLVASAVDGLDPDHVTLVDAAGRISFGPKGALAETALLEQTLADRVVSTLEPLTGRDNLRATVNVEYDLSNQEETQELYDPNGTVMLSMQRSEEGSGGQQRAAGIPGAASNVPNAGGATEGTTQPSNSLPLFPTNASPASSVKQESGSYAASKRTRHLVERPGRLKRLTVAVLVNDRLEWQGSGKDAHQAFVSRNPDDIKRIEALARAAVGFDERRGDTIAVENSSFAGNTVPHAPTLIERFAPSQQHVSQISWLLAPLAIFMMVFFFLVRPASRRIARAIEQPAASLPEPVQAGSLAVAAEESAGDATARRQQHHIPSGGEDIAAILAQRIAEEPAPVVRLLKTWINENGDAVEA
jgi:flagellar M-ring protein FliF